MKGWIWNKLDFDGGGHPSPPADPPPDDDDNDRQGQPDSGGDPKSS